MAINKTLGRSCAAGAPFSKEGKKEESAAQAPALRPLVKTLRREIDDIRQLPGSGILFNHFFNLLSCTVNENRFPLFIKFVQYFTKMTPDF
jgi:hypothetical protein